MAAPASYVSSMDYQVKRSRLIAYMHVKISEGDWHGVSDAANDLRVLEAEEYAIRACQRVPEVI